MCVGMYVKSLNTKPKKPTKLKLGVRALGNLREGIHLWNIFNFYLLYFVSLLLHATIKKFT
jgi:hypothetical protein